MTLRRSTAVLMSVAARRTVHRHSHLHSVGRLLHWPDGTPLLHTLPRRLDRHPRFGHAYRLLPPGAFVCLPHPLRRAPCCSSEAVDYAGTGVRSLTEKRHRLGHTCGLAVSAFAAWKRRHQDDETQIRRRANYNLRIVSPYCHVHLSIPSFISPLPLPHLLRSDHSHISRLRWKVVRRLEMSILVEREGGCRSRMRRRTGVGCDSRLHSSPVHQESSSGTGRTGQPVGNRRCWCQFASQIATIVLSSIRRQRDERSAELPLRFSLQRRHLPGMTSILRVESAVQDV